MNIYDIGNKNGYGFWVAAPDKETAIAIARKAGHIKSEPRAVHDVTESFRQMAEQQMADGITEILEGTVTGNVYGRGSAISVSDFIKGQRAAKMEWLVREIVV